MTKTPTPAADPAVARTRVIVGGILLALAWLLAAATVIALLVVLPDHHVRDYAAAVVAAGIFTAAGATYALIEGVFP